MWSPPPTTPSPGTTVYDDLRRICLPTASSRLKTLYTSQMDRLVKVKVLLRPTASRPVCLGVKHPYGPKTRFSLLSDSCGFVVVGRPLWREDGSAVYNCYWPSSAQSFSSLNPAGLMIIFYCLRFEIPPTWRNRSTYLYTPGTGWPSCTSRHWVPFHRLIRLTVLRWRCSNPTPRGVDWLVPLVLVI
jgi:hypothetical protein